MGQAEVYLGSADLMPRNIDRRVEALFPIQDVEMIRHIREDILDIYLKDNMKSRRMLSDGKYERVRPEGKEESINSQAWFLTQRGKLG
jgi:polyphosphate kinase